MSKEGSKESSNNQIEKEKKIKFIFWETNR